MLLGIPCLNGGASLWETPFVTQGARPTWARSPSSALLSPFWGEGSPTKIGLKKVGTLIPSSQIWRTERSWYPCPNLSKLEDPLGRVIFGERFLGLFLDEWVFHSLLI